MEAELPEGWRERALGDVIRLRYGKSLTKSTRQEGDVPVIGSAGVVDWHKEPLVTAPTIIIGRKGSLGTVYRFDVPTYPIDTVYFTELREPANWRWLEALLIHADLASLNEATGIPGLNRDRAHALRLPIPPLTEQQRIAEILTAVDEQIDAERRHVEQQKRLKRGLMDDLLTGRVRTV